jgi:hypothetical protein
MSAREFDCIECGRHIISFPAWGMHVGEDHGLCNACLMNPGWFKIRSVRELIAPEHDGLDAVERLQSKEAR